MFLHFVTDPRETGYERCGGLTGVGGQPVWGVDRCGASSIIRLGPSSVWEPYSQMT